MYISPLEECNNIYMMFQHEYFKEHTCHLGHYDNTHVMDRRMDVQTDNRKEIPVYQSTSAENTEKHFSD